MTDLLFWSCSCRIRGSRGSTYPPTGRTARIQWPAPQLPSGTPSPGISPRRSALCSAWYCTWLLALLAAIPLAAAVQETAQPMTLEECVAYALQHNPSLRQDQAGVDEALALRRSALGKGLGPTLKADGNVMRFDAANAVDFGGVSMVTREQTTKATRCSYAAADEPVDSRRVGAHGGQPPGCRQAEAPGDPQRRGLPGDRGVLPQPGGQGLPGDRREGPRVCRGARREGRAVPGPGPDPQVRVPQGARQPGPSGAERDRGPLRGGADRQPAGQPAGAARRPDGGDGADR